MARAMNVLAAARTCVERYRMSVFPLRPQDKRPPSSFLWKEFQNRRPTEDELERWFKVGERNLAIVTGAISGIVVIDIDGPKGEASIANLEVPHTVEVKTPNGRHLYFRHPGRFVRTRARLLPGVDVRADGGYVVAPPSEIGGGRYEFVHAPKDTALAELPAWFWKLAPREAIASTNGAEVESFIEGERNDRLASEAGSLRRRGWSVDDIADALLAFNARHCLPPLEEREVRGIAKSMGRYEPEGAAKTEPEPVAERVEDFTAEYWDEFQKQVDYHTEQTTWMNTVDMRSVEWLWPDFIPRGMVTIITGEEGLGKSQLALKIAAMYSSGTLKGQPEWAMSNPKDEMPGGLVKVYSAEDPLHQVLAPRMHANGATMSHVATEGIDVQTWLPDGIKDIARGIEELAFGMIIIDPVLAYLGGEADANSAQDVRAIMRMLADLAEISDTVIIGIMHPKKGEETQLLHKMIGGSSAFGQAARSVLAVARHPTEEDRRVVGRIKGNLSKVPNSVFYEIQSRTFERNGSRISTSQVEWKGEAPADFDFSAALAGRGASPKTDDRPAINEAITFLRAELGVAETLTADEVWERAKKAKISERTLKRAKAELGIISDRHGGRDGKWWWRLP